MRLRLLALSLLLGCAHAPPASTSLSAWPVQLGRRVVHRDTIAQGHLADFAAARKDWLAALRAHHTTDERGLFFQAGDHMLLTLWPFEAYADLDRRRTWAQQATASIEKAASDAYDQHSDVWLVAPHSSEIWAREPDLDCLAEDGPTNELEAFGGRVVFELLDPTPKSEEALEAAWKELAQALKRARYPLSRICFHSSYGSGQYVSFWVAKDKETLDGAPSLEEALTRQLGEAQAKALLARYQAGVVHAETLPLLARPDLNSPLPTHREDVAATRN
jgi:hypothetical protein